MAERASTATLGNLSGEELARRLEQDIRRRGLAAGTRYFSTRQASSRFGVSIATAGRAMQALVEGGILERRDRSGTYIASTSSADDHQGAAATETLFVISPSDRLGFTALPTEMLLVALHQAHPHATIQFAFLPAADQLDYLRRHLDPAIEADRVAGVIATSCSREVYARLAKMPVPVVVLGSLDPDQDNMVSIDIDHFESGRRLAERLIGRGHKRLAVFGVGEGRPGDFNFHDGVTQAMADAGLPPNALLNRSLPCDRELFRVQAHAVLGQADPPTGLICRGESILEGVAEAVAFLGADRDADLELVFQTFATPRLAHSPFAHVQTRVSFSHIGEKIAALLRRQRDGQPIETGSIVLPVELCVPPGAERKPSRPG